MKLRYDHWFPKFFNSLAIVLYPYIFFSIDASEVSVRLWKHEQAHFDQQKKLGLIKFLFLYAFEYVKNLFKYRNHWDAYWNITFEVEARKAEEFIQES